MAAEQVAYPFTFGQSGDHPVESALQPADFGALEDIDGGVETSTLDLGHRVDDFAYRIGDRPRREDHRRHSQKHRGERNHQYRHLHRRRSWDEPAVRSHHDQRHDYAAGQRAAQQPQQDQPRQHPGRDDEALGRLGGGGKNRSNDLHGQQKADARRGGSAQCDAESGRHDDADPTVDVEQDGERAADHPRARKERTLATAGVSSTLDADDRPGRAREGTTAVSERCS